MRRWLALCGLVAVVLTATPWVADVSARSGGGGFRSGSRATREDDGGFRSAPDDNSGIPAPDVPRSRPAKPRTVYSIVRRVVLGGVLGSIFFGGGAGSIGILELLVLSGLVILAYRALSRNQAGQQYAAAGAYGAPGLGLGSAGIEVQDAGDALARGVSAVRQADPSFDSAAFGDAVTGIFRQVQAAWAARDIARAGDVLTVEMRDKLATKAARLRALGRVNHVERITVTRVAITRARQHAGWDSVSVLIVATLVDYTTDEMGLKVLEGNPFEPVPFQERWELLRPSGPHPWRVSAIH